MLLLYLFHSTVTAWDAVLRGAVLGRCRVGPVQRWCTGFAAGRAMRPCSLSLQAAMGVLVRFFGGGLLCEALVLSDDGCPLGFSYAVKGQQIATEK